MKTMTKAQKTSQSKLTTVSANIRFLSSLGYTRSEIAKMTGKRYQHVRNVLITPLKGK